MADGGIMYDGAVCRESQFREKILMKHFASVRRFTLVELLIVVGIIAVLAGLVLPAVIGGIRQGKITQAKSDLAAIMMALKGVEGTYGKMVKADGSDYKFGGKTLTVTNGFISMGGDNSETDDATVAYNALIAELSVPNKVSSLNINKRKIKFLEPRAAFNPEKDYDHADNKPQLWRDPWGKPYKILINVTGEDSVKVGKDGGKPLAVKAAGYSCGPNGTDDKGCNANLNDCINTDTAHKLHDDVTSWD